MPMIFVLCYLLKREVLFVKERDAICIFVRGYVHVCIFCCVGAIVKDM